MNKNAFGRGLDRVAVKGVEAVTPRHWFDVYSSKIGFNEPAKAVLAGIGVKGQKYLKPQFDAMIKLAEGEIETGLAKTAQKLAQTSPRKRSALLAQQKKQLSLKAGSGGPITWVHVNTNDSEWKPSHGTPQVTDVLTPYEFVENISFDRHSAGMTLDEANAFVLDTYLNQVTGLVDNIIG
jgi:hypothetical protein